MICTRSNGCAKAGHCRCAIVRPPVSATDAAVAGDRLFVLERRLSLFGGWRNRIVMLPVAELPDRADDVIEGVELAVISGPVLGENYEGLNVRRVDDGSYALTVVADDNFNGVQHTQLLELRWRP